MTEILSNGSKWGGEEPDTIEQLIEVLKTHTIQEWFFEKYLVKHTEKRTVSVLCPIRKEKGNYIFFGNFEEVSHVFRIITDDLEVIKSLRTAIMNNKGWKKYLKNCKVVSKW